LQEFKSGTSQVNRLPVKPGALLDMRVPDDVQISPDGQHIVFVVWQRIGDDATRTGRIWIVDTAGGEPHPLTKGGGTESCPRWSPDGKQIAFVLTPKGEDKKSKPQLHLIASQGSEAKQVCTMPNGVSDLAWSPDGTRIASASYDGTVQVWEAKTGKLLVTYKGHNAPVWEVAWSPDGKRIVSGTGSAGINGPVTSNNSVKVWDAATGQTLLTYAEGSTGQTYALAWSPDGKRIASGGDDHYVHVWDAATGQTLLLYSGHSDIIFKVAWSPDGSLIASASADGTVQVWRPQV